jgi:DNA polymerase I
MWLVVYALTWFYLYGYEKDSMKNSTTPPFLLVDGSSYLFRAYHALPPLATQQGEPTGAIYGMISMLRKLLQDYPTPYIAVIFDGKEKNFRHVLYPAYKANRPPIAPDLAAQIAPLQTIIRAMGLPVIVAEGVEADDVIGSLAVQATAQGLQTVIITSDKDMAQLVNADVTLLNTMNNKRLDIAGVKEKFGVSPEQIIDYLALIGDSIDNIPGVPNVGPKTAAKWLQLYPSVEDVIANAMAIGGKVGESLRSCIEQLPLAKQLTTIRCDLPLDYSPLQLMSQAPDRVVLQELFQRFEFKQWLTELVKSAEPVVRQTNNYQMLTDEKSFAQWLEKLKQTTLFAFDTETTSLDTMQAEIVGVSFAVTAGEAAYIPLAHDYMGAPAQLSRELVLAALKPLLEDSGCAKVGQNLKYDQSVLANYAITLRGIEFDTMLESYVLNSTATRHDMDSLAAKYLNKKTITFEDVAGKGAKQLRFNQVPVEAATSYAAEDADITLQLHQTLWPKLQAIPKLATVLQEIDLPLVPVLSRMERQGVLIDHRLLAEQSQQLSDSISALQDKAYQLAGCVFNLSSPKQLQEILFEQLKLPVIKKTPGGQASTAEEVLQELAQEYELPQCILEYRSFSKLKSTYTDRLPERVNPITGRVHTSYHQAVTATGRLSSSDPNLQNIPIRTEQGRRIRQAFIAKPGYVMLAADYSQIELRIMAHLSQDAGLLRAFAQGLDVHAATAAEVFATPLASVNAEQRRRAKAINFGLIYGMSAFGLAKQLGIDRYDAQSYVDLYFKRYPGVAQYMENTRDLAHAQGYVETLFGRRLYLPEINVRNVQRQKAAERTAINAPMQGTAADIIKKAMLACDAWLLQQPEIGYMLMQVHDELVFEIAEDSVESAKQIITDLMQQAASLDVPLLVDVGYGANWDEAHA